MQRNFGTVPTACPVSAACPVLADEVPVEFSHCVQVPPLGCGVLKAAAHEWCFRDEDGGHGPQLQICENFFHLQAQRIGADPQSGSHRTATDPVEPAP